MAEQNNNSPLEDDSEEDEVPTDGRSAERFGLKIMTCFGVNAGPGKKFDDLLEVETMLDKKLGFKEGLDYQIKVERDRNHPMPNAGNVDKQLIRNLDIMVDYFVNGKLPIDKDIDEVEKQIKERLRDGEEIEQTETEPDKQKQSIEEEEELYNLQRRERFVPEPRQKEEKEWKHDKQKRKGVSKKGRKRQNEQNQKAKKNSNKQRKREITAVERDEVKKDDEAPKVPLMDLIKRRTELKKERQELVKKYDIQIEGVDEFHFIKNCGIDKSVAQQLAIADRIRLQKAFPELEQFYILCFKPDKHNITRRAFIYQKGNNEGLYVDSMKRFLSSKHKIFDEGMQSKIKVSFRGKYILKIDRNIYSNFEDTLLERFKNLNVQHSTFESALKIELQLRGNVDNPRAVKEAYEYACDLLRAEEFEFDSEYKDAYDLYCIFSSQGENIIAQKNNNYTGEIFLETNERFRRLTIRGIDSVKQRVSKDIREL